MGNGGTYNVTLLRPSCHGFWLSWLRKVLGLRQEQEKGHSGQGLGLAAPEERILLEYDEGSLLSSPHTFIAQAGLTRSLQCTEKLQLWLHLYSTCGQFSLTQSTGEKISNIIWAQWHSGGSDRQIYQLLAVPPTLKSNKNHLRPPCSGCSFIWGVRQ